MNINQAHIDFMESQGYKYSRERGFYKDELPPELSEIFKPFSEKEDD